MLLSSIGRRMLVHCREYDKRQHFAYSFLIMLLASLGLNLWPAILCVLSVGLAKEIWDHFWGSGFCWIDMAANLLGTLAAVPIVLVVNQGAIEDPAYIVILGYLLN